MHARKRKTTRSNSARSTQRRPQIAAAMEPLEQRLLLSGTITSTLDSLGNLSIVGGAEANDISIVKNGNSVIITRNDGEAFAGAGTNAGETRVINNVTRNIRISLLGGADRLTLGVAGGQFWVGDVSDYDEDVQDSPWNPRDLTIDMGGLLADGADLLTLVGVKCRNLDIKTGAGNNRVTILDNGGAEEMESCTAVFGKLSIASGNDGCTIDIAGAHVGKDATISMGNGANTVTIRENTHLDEGSNPEPTYSSWFGGNLAITGGAGQDIVNLRSSVADWQMDIDGDLSVKLQGAPLDHANTLTLSGVCVMGNAAYAGGAGPDAVVLANQDFSVMGSASFAMFAGANSLTMAASLTMETGGDITYTGGLDADSITGGALRSARNINLNLGAGENSLSLQQDSGTIVEASRSFTYTGLDGNDTITLEATNVYVGRDFIVKAGNGANSFSSQGLVEDVIAGRNFTYTGGTGDDDVLGNGFIIGGSISIALGAGDNTFEAVSDMDADFQVHQDFSITGGTGGDSIMLNLDAELESVIGDAFSMNLGAGENEFSLRGSSTLMVVGDMSYTGLNDGDTISFMTNVTIVGNFTVKAGGGINDVCLAPDGGEFNLIGDFSYNGGSNEDAMGADGDVIIDGDVRWQLFDGDNSMKLAAGTEFTVNGAFSCTAGAGTDLISVDAEVSVLGDTSFKLGAGANSLTLSGGAVLGRNFTYDGLGGVDRLDCRNIKVTRDTTIKTGEGDDVVALYDDSRFNKFTVDVGGGNDKVYLGDNAARSGQKNLAEYLYTAVKGAASLKLGAGNDDAYLGYNDGIGTNLTFMFMDESVSVEGGLGVNTGVIGKGWFAFAPKATGLQ